MGAYPAGQTYTEQSDRALQQNFPSSVLDSYMFDNLAAIRKYANAWAWVYNNERPHSALGNLTPTEFLFKYGKIPAIDGQGQFPTLQQDNNKSDWNYLVLGVAS